MRHLAWLCFVIGCCAVLTPVWYPLYMRIHNRRKHDGTGRRIRMLTLIDWLNACGIGFFLGALLLGAVKYLARAGR